MWTLNLMAHPEATLTIKGKKIPVTARLLEGEERTGIWPVLIETWPNFDVYTERSGRELRVFELTPR
jgi:deazaflavin-dependent oxidoreductase (nitroreductase family)